MANECVEQALLTAKEKNKRCVLLWDLKSLKVKQWLTCKSFTWYCEKQWMQKESLTGKPS